MQKIFVIAALFMLACTSKKENSKKPPVLSLKEMSELATVEYTVTKVVKANDNKTWFKIGDRKILMSCEAHIKAGIDMSTINEKNFNINGKTIDVYLPQPKIISISLPPESIKIEYEEVAVLRDNFSNADRDALAAQAEHQIRANVYSLGIINQAKINTSLFVNNFLKKLGFENIRITYKSDPQPITEP